MSAGRVVARLRPADGALELVVDDAVVGSCGVERRTHGRRRAAVHEVVLGPWRLPADRALAACAVRAALRSIVVDERPWHQITLQDDGGNGVIVDAAWRYALGVGARCDIGADLDVSGRAAVAGTTIWSTETKGRARRAMLALQAPPERPANRHAVGTRYFTLDIAAAPRPNDPVILTEVPEAALYGGVAFRLAHRYGATARAVESAVCRGDRCFVVTDDATGGDLYRMWVSADERHVAALVPSSIARPPVLYAYECYTAPEARGRRLYGRALLALAALERERYRQLVVRINPDNVASIKGVLSAGFVEATP